MINGKTKSGFSYSIDERIFDDWRLISAIVATQGADDLAKIKGVCDMAVLLLGEDGMKLLTEHIASVNDGFVPAPVLMAEVSEIIEANKVSKNS